MSDTKTELKFFSITEYDEEAKYLREMHKSGWKLSHISFIGIYHFYKCTPEDVVYQLDYNKDGLANKDEYVQMFKDCGWEYMFEFVGYSYFRKPAAQMQEGEEEIFCDDESRLDMLQRVMRGRLLPMLIIFCTIILPQLFMNVTHVFEGDKDASIVVVVFGLMLVAYMWVFASYTKKYYKIKKAIKR